MASTAAVSDGVAPTGELRVTADIHGGAVWLDGADTGRAAPVLLSGLAPGKHAVEVRMPGAQGASTATVAPGHIGRVELVLRTRTAASAPSGATVVIDGVDGGVTPFETDTLTYGTHALALRLPDHLGVTMSVDARAFERNDAHAFHGGSRLRRAGRRARPAGGGRGA